MSRSVSLVLASLAVALSVVTATVTIARGQPAGTFQVVITNLANGSKHEYTRKTWPDQNRCAVALGNWPEIMRAVADPDPEVKVPDPVAGDPDLSDRLLQLVMSIFQNTGHLPKFSISCEVAGNPA